MIYCVFYKEVRTTKDEFDIVYYIETNRDSVSLIYEFTGLYKYDFRKYSVKLNYHIRNEYLIIQNVLESFEKVYSTFNETRKLSILSKFVLYVISKDLNIPLYKLIKNVIYEANGDVQQLSVNAFIKSSYKLAQKFQELGF